MSEWEKRVLLKHPLFCVSIGLFSLWAFVTGSFPDAYDEAE
ncbi:hypothetical protein [Halobacillus kuroshimensis]|nr:hypothetical protein [Halobacillus kuroshimensis]